MYLQSIKSTLKNSYLLTSIFRSKQNLGGINIKTLTTIITTPLLNSQSILYNNNKCLHTKSYNPPILNQSIQDFPKKYEKLSSNTQMKLMKSFDQLWCGLTKNTCNIFTNTFEWNFSIHSKCMKTPQLISIRNLSTAILTAAVNNNNNIDDTTGNLTSDVFKINATTNTPNTNLNHNINLIGEVNQMHQTKSIINFNNDNDVGVCLKIHLHFRKDELNTYKLNNDAVTTTATNPEHINYEKDTTTNTTTSTTTVNILDKQCNNNNSADDLGKNSNVINDVSVGGTIVNTDKGYPDFIGIHLKFQIEDVDGQFKADNLHFSEINVQGSLPFTKHIPANVFVYHGIGKCKVKCF